MTQYTVMVEQNYPPEPPNPAAGQKGRKSHKIEGAGQKFFANPPTGNQIMVGQTYTFETSVDGFGNVWINSAAVAGGMAPQQPQTPPQQPQGHAQASQAAMTGKNKDRSIVLQSILKACGGDIGKSGMAVRWYQMMLLRGWDDAMREQIDVALPPAPPTPLDDEIPDF